MIKYSLALLAATAVVFSVVGCEGECCGTLKKAPDKNVAPVITRVLGVTNNSTKDCTANSPVTLSADSSDANGNLDRSTYSWSVDDKDYQGNSIDCPVVGQTKEVCATVKDKEGLESNEVCVTLKGKAVATDCNPYITIKDENGTEVTSVKKGKKYDFNNNVVEADCPNVECTWSVRSHRADNGGADNSPWFTCLIKNSHVGTDDELLVDKEGGTYHVNLNGSGNTASINVQTCASLYDFFEVDLNCTNPLHNETKKLNLQ